MIIPNQKQALAELKPHGYNRRTSVDSIASADLWEAEVSGAGGKVKTNRPNRKPRPFTPAGHASSPPTSPDFGGTGLKVMGS